MSSTKNITKLKRNPQVELMRIIACFIVLSCHCNFSIIVDTPNSIYKLYYSSLLGDAVTIFFMITGFFIFRNKDYLSLWKHTLIKIIVPMLALFVVVFYFGDFLTGQSSLQDSISHSGNDYFVFFRNILCFNAPTEQYTAHTWYVFAYILIILIYPLLKAIVDYLDSSTKREIVFLIISAALFIINDIYINNFLELSFHGASVVFSASVEIIWGHIIYKHRDIITKKLFIIIMPILFFAINALRSFIEYFRVQNGTSNGQFIFCWNSIFAFLCAITIISFAFSIIKPEKICKSNRLIVFLASYTYGIYLLHLLIQGVITHMGYFTKAHDYLTQYLPEAICGAVTIIIGAIIVFTIGLIICILIRLLLKGLKLLLYKMKSSNANA